LILFDADFKIPAGKNPDKKFFIEICYLLHLIISSIKNAIITFIKL